MKKIEIFAVRYTILLVSVYLLLTIIYAHKGISLSSQEYLSGHSFILDGLLSILCWNNKRYHCRYMFALCINLVIVDVIGYFHANISVIESSLMLDIYSKMYVLATIITIILAIRHFIIKRKNRFKEYKLK